MISKFCKKIEIPSSVNNELFVIQLKELGYSRLIESAKRDYWRVHLLRLEKLDIDWEMYNQILIDEWEHVFSLECDKFELENNELISRLSKKNRQKIGMVIYGKLMDKYIPIKSDIIDEIEKLPLMRGSYYSLANSRVICWYPS